MTDSPEQRRDRRARQAARTEANDGVAPVEAHNRSTYSEWRCRCPECVAANRADNVGRKALVRVHAAGDTTWIAEAPCAGSPGKFDLPVGFSPMQITLWARGPLAMCAGCSFRQECIELVNPRANKSDIVAGGIVWRDGKPVRMVEPRPPAVERPNVPLQPCGTRGAYTRHQRRGDPIDDACRKANSAYQRSLQRPATEAS